jgi:RNA-directed DNA polymerase
MYIITHNEELRQDIFRNNPIKSRDLSVIYLENSLCVSGMQVISIDIRKFYENCSREYIYQFFKNSLHTSSDVAVILTTIVTLENKLPTGSPTSQIIAYYAYQKMFNEIHDIAEQYGCIFTLYVDDMTFSSILPFNTSQLKNKIDIELRRYSHKPKYSKIKYFSKKKHKVVTGVSITP